MIKIISLILGLTLTFSAWGQNIDANKDLPTNHQQIKLRPNDTLNIYLKKNKKYKTTVKEFENMLRHINDSLVKKGYIFTKIIPDSMVSKENKWHFYAHIELFKKKHIDSVVFISSDRIPKNIVKNFNRKFQLKTLNKNTLQDLKKQCQQQTKLSIKTSPYINFKKGQSLVILNIKQKNQNTVAGLIGFNYNAKDKKLQLNGLLNLQLYNILNTGESLAFKWQKMQDYQELKFDVLFKMIKGTDFEIRNTFYSKRKDTTYAGISDEIILNYQIKKQRFGLNYFVQKTDEINKSSNHLNLIGCNYNYNSSLNLSLNIKSDLSNLNHFMVYLNTAYTWKIKKHFFLKTTDIAYINKTQNNLQYYNLIPHLFRKPVIDHLNFLETYSMMNNIGYSNKKTNIFMIADFIFKKRTEKMHKYYINNGIGIEVLHKNQNLTLEILKVIYSSYQTDNKRFIINIKQTYRF